MTQKLECPRCNEMREPSYYQDNNAQSGGKNYWCKSCVKNLRTQVKHSKERFKRNPSPCDSRLADRELKNSLKEIWEME